MIADPCGNNCGKLLIIFIVVVAIYIIIIHMNCLVWGDGGLTTVCQSSGPQTTNCYLLWKMDFLQIISTEEGS